jgi:beta-phosphoglucomutase
VLVDSPHSRAWQDALRELMETEWAGIRDWTRYSPERFTDAIYQQIIAGLPRLAGARAALEYFGVPEADRKAELYAAVKQEHLVNLIELGRFTAFADALRFVLAVKAVGIRVAAASSSQNADLVMRPVRLDTFAAEERKGNQVARRARTLVGLLDADISGEALLNGKPDSMIFLAAARELRVPPGRCFVAEDAVPGVGPPRPRARWPWAPLSRSWRRRAEHSRALSMARGCSSHPQVRSRHPRRRHRERPLPQPRQCRHPSAGPTPATAGVNLDFLVN